MINLLIIITGLLSGIFSGTLGVSATFMIIILIRAFNLLKDDETIAGTTLLSILPPVALIAVIQYWKKGKINVKMAIIISIFALLGGGIGAKIGEYIKPKTKKIILTFVFFCLGIYTIYSIIKEEKATQDSSLHSIKKPDKNNFFFTVSKKLSGITL